MFHIGNMFDLCAMVYYLSCLLQSLFNFIGNLVIRIRKYSPSEVMPDIRDR